MSETSEPTPGNKPPANAQASIKPGWKTTEFWITVAIALAAFGEQIVGILPPEYAVGVAAFSAAIYKVTRALKLSGGGNGQ